MLSGNRRRRVQRITVGVLVGALILSLALSLVSVAWASPVGATVAPGRGAIAHGLPADGSTPAPSDEPLIGTSGAPKPVTKTPQGQATQVTDAEHIGGLVAFIAFMLGGVLLLLRGRRRDRRERASDPILS